MESIIIKKMYDHRHIDLQISQSIRFMTQSSISRQLSQLAIVNRKDISRSQPSNCAL